MKKNYEELLENAKKNSIGQDKKSDLVMGVKDISKKAMTAMLITALSLSLCACNNKKQTIEVPNVDTNIVVQIDRDDISATDYDFDYKTISGIKSDKIAKARAQLKIANIIYCDEYGRILSNDVEVYKSLKDLDESDLIGYYSILKKNESEKIIIALGYEGWDDYLIQYGYVDEDGKPQIEMWEYSVYENMQKEMESGLGK